MRFQIGPGGAFLILVGLAGLSCGVFALGLLAGHELARQNQSEPEQAGVYPLPSPPASQPSPAEAAAIPTEAVPEIPLPGAALSPAAMPSPRGPEADLVPPAPVPSEVKPPQVASKSATAKSATSSGAKAEKAAVAEKPEGKHPFSVQIEAVMDQQSAQAMADRLKRAGFEPYVVQTDVNGQTWYRVRVGHYATESEAADAQARLQQQFSGAFTTQ